jgi:hypothetical protein
MEVVRSSETPKLSTELHIAIFQKISILSTRDREDLKFAAVVE